MNIYITKYLSFIIIIFLFLISTLRYGIGNDYFDYFEQVVSFTKYREIQNYELFNILSLSLSLISEKYSSFFFFAFIIKISIFIIFMINKKRCSLNIFS
jgi:hypothetical protein